MLKNAKIYHDGSHYIVIPHTKGISGPKRKKSEPPIAILNTNSAIRISENVNETEKIQGSQAIFDAALQSENASVEQDNSKAQSPSTADLLNDAELRSLIPEAARGMSRKDVFNELLKNCKGMRKKEKRQFLKDNLVPFFENEKDLDTFIDEQLERVRRNTLVRKLRLSRKVNLANFNFFVTFTYSDKLHTEETFRKQLVTLLQNNSSRKGWKYCGVWERSPEKQRLHFHAMMTIPEGTMPGELVEVRDYDTKAHKMQTTLQNTYFTKYFGRSDFRKLDYPDAKNDALKYITKYLEKSGEKLVCSKGLYMYINADVNEDDIVCKLYEDGNKSVLFDNFTCIKDGNVIGTADDSKVIAQMPKCN